MHHVMCGAQMFSGRFQNTNSASLPESDCKGKNIF